MEFKTAFLVFLQLTASGDCDENKVTESLI